MASFKWTSFALVPFCLLFFNLFACNLSATSTQLISNISQDDIDICKMVYCGKGTCNRSPNDFFGFKCDCDYGWKKFNMGSFEFPSCVLPDCTFDFQCGNGSPPTPPRPSLNLSDPCSLNLCGDGTCERSGSEFRCQCYEGSTNLLNDPKLTCFKKCALGVDCKGLDLGFGSPAIQTPPATQSLPSQLPGNSGSSRTVTGSGEMLSYSRELHAITKMILATIFLKWI